MMPFFTTSPISRISPIADETFRSVPVASRRSSAPPSDSGAATRISRAGVNARNCITSTVKTSTAAMPNTVSSSRNACRCDSYWPPIS